MKQRWHWYDAMLFGDYLRSPTLATVVDSRTELSMASWHYCIMICGECSLHCLFWVYFPCDGWPDNTLRVIDGRWEIRFGLFLHGLRSIWFAFGVVGEERMISWMRDMRLTCGLSSCLLCSWSLWSSWVDTPYRMILPPARLSTCLWYQQRAVLQNNRPCSIQYS